MLFLDEGLVDVYDGRLAEVSPYFCFEIEK